MTVNFKRLHKLFSILLLALIGGACLAQSPNPRSISSPYRLQREDILQIQVFGQQQITAQVPVGSIDGRISAPFLDTIPAAGRTLDELRADLTEQYKKKMLLRDPIVSLTIIAYRQQKASIGGAIQRPGLYGVRPGDTILGLYNQGGGEQEDQADLRRAFLRHANTYETIPIDLFAMTVLGDMSQNYEVKDGDELTIPAQKLRINIQGAVMRPGQYPYHDPMNLEDAVALAGGEIRYRSKFSHTIVMRQRPGMPGEYVTIISDLVKFVRKGDASQNIALQPGDFIFVPESDSPDFNQIGALFNIAYIFNLISGGTVFNRLFGH